MRGVCKTAYARGASAGARASKGARARVDGQSPVKIRSESSYELTESTRGRTASEPANPQRGGRG
eukprot:4006654-Pleurochrysis_carterae.AAC.1